MEVFRLARMAYSDLDGKGAAIMGGRWNSLGIEMVYTAMNRSLAMAEVAVHLTTATLPDDFYILTIFIPDDLSIKKLNLKDLPEDWNTFPPPSSTQWIGNNFIFNNEHCALQVPSAVTYGDFILLLNPNHPEFKKIKIIKKEKFPFDSRIFKDV